MTGSGQGSVDLVTDSDQYHYLTQGYRGTQFAAYLVTKKGRSIPLTFSPSQLKKFEWLVYSPSQGGGYCKYCVLLQAKLPKEVGTLVKGVLG